MMNAIKQFLFRFTGLAVATGALMLTISLLGFVRPVMAAAIPPSAACTASAGSVTCNLYAATGTAAMPDGSSVPVWGYAATSGGAPTLPGPVIIGNVGDTLTVTLHNVNLPEDTSLNFPFSDLAPDTVGVTAGNSKTYTFSLSSPGTFSYEAGLTAGVDHQVAMGLYGALIVRPAVATQAYNDASTTFDDEGLVVFSEVDPALNAAPTTFDMRTFKPRFWLINGLGYPNIPAVSSAAGHKVLLRYLNAGMQERTPTLLGATQTVIGISGQPEAFAYAVTSESIGAGMTLDTLVTLPSSDAVGTKYPLYDRGLHLDNAATALAGNTASIPLGGMLFNVSVDTSAAAAPAALPVTSGVAVNPTLSAPAGTAALTGTITSGTGTVDQAQYFVDSLASAPAAITPGASPFSFNVSVPLSGLTTGDHFLFVQGHDANGWGPVSSAVITILADGPAVSGITLSPANTNGSVNVTIQGTANDNFSSKTNVTASEFYIDSTGGTANALGNNGPSPIVALNGSIPAATVAALAEGPHTLYLRAQDQLGTWGGFATAILNVDKTGPVVNTISASPNPNSGQIPLNATIGAVEVSALLADPLVANVNSTVTQAEVFIDNQGANGTGIPLVSRTSLFDSTTVAAYADIPLPTITALSNGPHPFWVHAKDAAGNWGPFTSVTLNVDHQGPAVSAIQVSPTRVVINRAFTLTATATDPVNTNSFGTFAGQNVVYGEYWLASPSFGAPLAFTGTFTSSTVNMTANITPTRVKGWVVGPNTVFIRTRDALGNWGPTVSTVVNVTLPPIFVPLIIR